MWPSTQCVGGPPTDSTTTTGPRSSLPKLPAAKLYQVTDEIVADLLHRFGEPGVVELAYLVALENMRSRFNSTLGLTTQGFSR